MRSRIVAVAAASIASLALAGSALAHGGSYIGTGIGVSTGQTGIPAPGTTGPGSGPLGPGGSTGATFGGKNPITGDGGSLLFASWEDWWHFNKEPYLDLKRAVRARTPTTHSDDVDADLRGRVGDPGALSEALIRQRIAPALAKLLDDERANEIQGGALVALARLGEPAASREGLAAGARATAAGGPASRAGAAAEEARSTVQRIARFLPDANQETAETAALALGILRSDDSLPLLQDLLAGDAQGQKLVGGREVPVRTRAFAAYGLGLIAESAKNNRTRQIVARALTDAFEGRSVRGSVKARAGTGPGVDVQVAVMIAVSLDPLAVEPVESASAPWISRQTILHWLEGVFSDPKRHAYVRAHAATAIARLAQDAPEPLRVEAAEILLASVRAKSKLENEVVESCAQALGLLGDSDGDKLDREIRNALGLLLDDSDVLTRSFALIALAEIGARPGPGDGNDEGLNGCRNMIAGELVRGRRWIRPWAAIALGVLERRILELQAGGANGAAGTSGGRLASAALPRPSESVRELLRGFLADARVRDQIGSAAIALGLCRDAKATPILLGKLNDASEDNGQGYVALSLGMIGAQGAALPLRALLRSAKHRMSLLEDAAISLALLGDQPTANELVDLLPGASGQAAQVSLANAIGFIGDAHAVDPLLRAIERADLTSSTRAFAASALGRVADKDLLPWFAPVSRDLNYVARPASLLAGDGTGLLEIL